MDVKNGSPARSHVLHAKTAVKSSDGFTGVVDRTEVVTFADGAYSYQRAKIIWDAPAPVAMLEGSSENLQTILRRGLTDYHARHFGR